GGVCSADERGGPRLPAQPLLRHRRAAPRRTGAHRHHARAAPLRGAQEGVRGDRRVHPCRDLGRRGLAAVPGAARGHLRQGAGGGASRTDLSTGRTPVTRRCPHPVALAHLPRCQVCRVEASPWSRGGRRGGATRGRRHGAGRCAVTHHDHEDGPAGARHVPVALPRVAELLRPALADRRAVLVDATLGLGGHASALLAEHPRLTLVGLDRDPEALEMARRRLAAHADRIRLVHAVYDRIADVLGELGLPRVDGVLFDLGVSSLQLDVTDRGFSYARDADLDMRMDPTTGITAAEVLNTYPVPELARVLREYGEERFANRIASAVARRRAKAPLRRSSELVELLYEVVPAASRRTGGHPAKRTFQALRIEVNGELDALRAALPAAIDALAVGGRIVVLAYHSLED